MAHIQVRGNGSRTAGWQRRLSTMLAAVLLATLLAVPAQSSRAVGMNVTYDPTMNGAIDPCAEELVACADGVDRTEDLELLIQVAAAYWAVIFHDAQQIDVSFAWVMDQAPSANVTAVDGNGKPTAAQLRVPADIDWFYDPTPFDDEEYEMKPKLYRTIHSHEQDEAFKGSPPEILEVGFNGEEVDDTKPDLLTVLLHEIGHILGLEGDVSGFGPNPTCSEDDPYYYVNPDLVGGASMSIKAFAITEDFPIGLAPGANLDAATDSARPLGHFDVIVTGYDCGHLALGGIKECGGDDECKSHQALMWPGMLPDARSRPSISDILAIATAAGWEEIHMPRKYSLETGLWNDGETWMGNRVPNAGNDVYIVNQESAVLVSAYDGGAARNLLITDGNDLAVAFELLDVYSLTLEGEGTTASFDSGAVLDAVSARVGNGSMLDLAVGATADIYSTLQNEGTIRGGGDSVIELQELDNRGTIRANGDSLTIVATHDGPALDLDGESEWPNDRVIDALHGDIYFEGQINDPVSAAVVIGSGHEVGFSAGWEQSYTGDPATALQLLGTSAPATVNGDSVIGGFIQVDGTGHFTSNVAFDPFSHTEIDLGGLAPESEHDQIIVDQHVAFDGYLDLSLANGFMPEANDEFVIMTYSGHSGTYNEVSGWDLGDLRLYPEYGDSELRIVARALGDVNGDGEVSNKDISEIAKNFGPCPADPVPCPGDIDGDGNIDQHDLHLLLDILH